MRSILVANPKGGSGKSTLSTNLAAYYANQGLQVMLADADRQRSALRWLSLRPHSVARIQGSEVDAAERVEAPRDTQLMVLDSPAGLHGKKLTALLKQVDHVLVPIEPSPFSIWATEDFFQQLLAEKALRKSRVFLGVVGMRVDARTRSAHDLEQFLLEQDIPVLSCLRATQLYVQAAKQGLGLFDLLPSRTRQDRLAWEPIIRWLALARPAEHWCDK